MQVIFGGAFNGKREYVAGLVADQQVQWVEGTKGIPTLGSNIDVVVVLGIESLLEVELNKWLAQMDQWENSVEVMVIATEIGRGIVPMEASLRRLRDDVGRFYQQLFARASVITRIWYGIPQTIKGDGQIENLHKNR